MTPEMSGIVISYSFEVRQARSVMKWRLFAAAALFALVGFSVSACSAGGSGVDTKPAASSSSAPSATAHPIAHVGSLIDVGGSHGLGITLTQVIDPAQGADQFTTPDAGKRFVAVELSIKNNGSATYSDDANNDTSVIGSDNQSYTADFDSVSECTNFNDGDIRLAAGESISGCVVFQLPTGINAVKVQYTPDSGFSGSTGEWQVP